jgi:hypothetical protein
MPAGDQTSTPAPPRLATIALSSTLLTLVHTCAGGVERGQQRQCLFPHRCLDQKWLPQLGFSSSATSCPVAVDGCYVVRGVGPVDAAEEFDVWQPPHRLWCLCWSQPSRPSGELFGIQAPPRGSVFRAPRLEKLKRSLRAGSA